MTRTANRVARRSATTPDAVTTVVPTKQLAVSTFRAGERGFPSVLSVEIGDHIAYFSGGAGRARVYATTDAKKIHRRQAPDANGLRGIRVMDDEMWICGEYGTLAVSTDRSGSWTDVQTPNRECLWDVVRDPKGAYWIGGSGNTILKAAKRDAAFKVVKHKLKARDDRADPRVELVPVGVMFPLFNAYWNGKQFVKPKGLKGAMGALAIAPTGTIIIVGDSGAAFRSTDGGASYKAVKTGVRVHLEDAAIVGGGFVIVGDKGTIRRSEDDGVTWKPIASGTKAHLWSVGSWGGGAFVGGDDGLILRIEAPGDTYWKGATDELAPKPVVAAEITALGRISDEERAARFAKRFEEAEAVHASYAAKLAQPKHALDEQARSILASIDDVDVYKVLGDSLLEAGDPRGELIALQTAGETKAANKHLKKHREALLGGVADLDKVKVDWRNGFIHSARVAYTGGPEDLDALGDYDDEESEDEVAQWIATLLDEPAARFMQELTVGIVQMVDNSYDKVMREIGRRPRPALRTLYLGDFNSYETEISWSDLGDATKLCGACEQLQKLTLRSGSMNLGKPGQLAFPQLRELHIVTGGFSKTGLKAIEGAHLPSLEKLTLYFGGDRYGCDIKRAKDLDKLLASERFPRLTRLGLCNSEIADELCTVMHLSPLVAQVNELDLGSGTLSDLGARTLATYARGLAHLTKLDISCSYVSKQAIKMLEKALPNTDVIAVDQRGSGDQFERRYVSISE